MIGHSVLAVVTFCLALPESASSALTPSCRRAPDSVDADVYDCRLQNGHVTIYLERSLNYVKIVCESGGFDCGDLLPMAELSNRTVPKLWLEDCKLPGSGVACVLRALGAEGGCTTLRLDYVPGGALPALGPEQLAHLPLLKLLVTERQGAGIFVEPPVGLSTAPNLTQLALMGTDLVLAPDAFTIAPRLESLKLTGSGILELPPGSFRGLSRLRTLTLFNQHVKRVGDGAFEGLEALEELDLSSSGVQELEPEAFATLRNLKVLHLSDNNLTELDSRLLGSLSQLQTLVIRNSVELRIGEGALGSLPALSTVRLTSCHLRTLPPNMLANSIALANLDLSKNFLKQLPPGLFRDQRNLRILDLSKNLIEELTKSIFSGLGAVEEINLSNNRLQVIDVGAFRGAMSLRRLTLAHNKLSFELGPDEYSPLSSSSPLSDLPNLQNLDLAYNNISAIFDDWRISMTTLKLLNLSHNNFELILQDTDFNFVQDNITVDLRFNRIRNIVQSRLFNWTVADKSSATKILLDENPFACDCQLYQFLAWQRDLAAPGGQRPDLGVARCAEPAAMQNLPLNSVPLRELRCEATPCPRGCSCNREPASWLLHLTCADPPALADVDQLAAANDVIGYKIALQLNRTPPHGFALHPHVVELDLAGLNLTEVPPVVLENDLLFLDLSRNQLPTLPPALLKAAGPKMQLAGNPLKCTCDYAAEVAALQRQRTRIVDYDRLNCSTDDPFGLKDASALCTARTAALIGGSLTALGFLVALTALLAFLFRRELYYLALRLGLWKDPDWDKPYDAFVSFCHRDHWFVVEQLVERLEGGGRPLRLCLHYRDWLGGAWVPEQIARSVRESRRTLLVLSEHYLRSRWSLLEFRAAAECALRENRVRLVVVMLRDVTDDPQMPPDLRAYLRVNTYLVWGEPNFWRRLQDALPLPRPHAPVSSPDKLARPSLAAQWLTAAGESVESRSPPAL